MKILLPKGCKVCFNPTLGVETTLESDLTVTDARWGVNGSNGYVFGYNTEEQPTAYTTDWQRIVELPD